MPWQQRELTESKWHGQLVLSFDGALSELEGALPTFSRKKLTYGPALNEYLDLILREPVPGDEREVPVATVSKRYALIQHREAVRWIVSAFEQMKWNPAKLPMQALISDYGERMRAAVQIPTDAVDPGDSYELYAEVLLWNSVDRSRAFELAIRWKRLVCKNGLTISNEDRMRKIHNVDWMASESPSDFLTDRLPASRNRMVEIGQWLNVHLEENRLIEWANHDVTKQWGIIRAARLVHVHRTGRDCAVGKPREGKRASQVEVVPGIAVPGARAPVGNAYHAYQALLWITNAEHSIDMQEELLGDVIGLMRPLLPSNVS